MHKKDWLSGRFQTTLPYSLIAVSMNHGTYFKFVDQFSKLASQISNA
jgi:hypothetical protein